MYKKLRMKMTLFCTAVTGVILLAMTLAGLLAFQNLLDANDAAVHDKEVDSVLAYLEKSRVIDYGQIATMANPRFYTIDLYENGVLYSYDPEEEKQEMMDKIIHRAMEHYGFDVNHPPLGKGITKPLEFSFDHKKTEHLVTFASVPYPYGTLCCDFLRKRNIGTADSVFICGFYGH